MAMIAPILFGVVVAGVLLLVWPCMEQARPVTPGAKTEVVARWAFLGLVLGCFAYIFLWQFMEPVGQPTGGAMAMVYLVTSPWAWGFLSLCALSTALVPVMALGRGTETSYGRLLYFLAGVWALGLLLAETLAVLAYRAELRDQHWDWSLVNLFTLSVPAALVLVVLVAPSWHE